MDGYECEVKVCLLIGIPKLNSRDEVTMERNRTLIKNIIDNNLVKGRPLPRSLPHEARDKFPASDRNPAPWFTPASIFWGVAEAARIKTLPRPSAYSKARNGTNVPGQKIHSRDVPCGLSNWHSCLCGSFWPSSSFLRTCYRFHSTVDDAAQHYSMHITSDCRTLHLTNPLVWRLMISSSMKTEEGQR
jgi:hypothetical protein